MERYIEKKIGKHTMRMSATQRGLAGTLRKWKDGNMNAKREPELLYVIEKELKPGMVVVDLGANIGYVSLIMADLMKGKGIIHCIEPDHRNAPLLDYNIKVNVNKFGYNMKRHNLAISNKNGKSKFCVANSSNLSSMTKTKATRGIVQVKTRTLTKFFEGKEPPNFIKMDVEGHECEILDGAYDLFKKNDFPCNIIMEIHPQFYNSKHSLEAQMRRYIDDLGFKTKYIISAAVSVPDLFKELGYTKPLKSFKSSGYNRAIYDNFKNEDMYKVACYAHKQYVAARKKWSKKIVRYVMIGRI